jgi:hypothetical protein
MPAKPKSAKRSAKVSAKAKAYDNKLWQKLDYVYPEDRDWMHDFFYHRRHLATARNGGTRDLKYRIELDKMDAFTCDGLERIYKRDGKEIGDEVALDLLKEVLQSIAFARGSLPKPWLRMRKELVAEFWKREARKDARMRPGDRPAPAAH